MTEIAKKPIQWLQVKYLHECTPLADDDLECMKDVRAALAKHGSLDRFAHLVHEHFAIPDDQILVEYSKAHTHEQYDKLAWCRPQLRSIGNTHETRSPLNFLAVSCAELPEQLSKEWL